MKKIINNTRGKIIVVGLFLLMIVFVLTGIFFTSYAYTEPISSIFFQSNKLNYEEKEPGSFQVEKSAKWIDKKKAQITFQVDTIVKAENQEKDIILVLDNSKSMDDNKLFSLKEESKKFIEKTLSNTNNKIALITYNTTSEIVSGFTNQKQELINKIDSLISGGNSNYYEAFLNVDSLLKDYVKEENRDTILLFVTSSYPTIQTPTEVSKYQYLKEEYPYLTIQGIEYEMGNEVIDQVKKVSDNQYLANTNNLSEVLESVSVNANVYDKFILTDYIDTDYFLIESKNDIKASQGKIEFDSEEQKVIWTMKGLRSGSRPFLTIDIILKEEPKNEGFYKTNIRETVESSISGIEESIESDLTPILKNRYKVIYEGNQPEGCSVTGLPSEEIHHVLETVEISDSIPTCKGYQFKGWKIVEDNIIRIGRYYFKMPEGDVILRAEWSNLSISKTMDGEVYEYAPAVMRKVDSNDTKDIWNYKSSITKVVFQNSINKIDGAEEFDISEAGNGSVMAYALKNSDGATYTAYIQSEGKIGANPDSSNLFNNFIKLKSIEGLEYLDTSNVTNMHQMFRGCSSLMSLDLSNFDTSNVTNMINVFSGCSGLLWLDVSNLDTSKVTNMSSVFYNCRSLTSLDVSSFDTSDVTDMDSMFGQCKKISSLNLSNFDTSNVTDMSFMFYMYRGNGNKDEYSKLESLDLSNFDTSNVTDMSNMFSWCSSLTNLDISNFDTANVTNMSWMFYDCSGLTNLDTYNFDTSNVTSMQSMFSSCQNLAVLDVSNFDTSNVTDMTTMFSGCRSLTSLDVSKFDTSNVTNMGSMFSGCRGLTSLDVSNFDTSRVTKMNSMFGNCANLRDLKIFAIIGTQSIKVDEMFYFCSSLNITIDIYNWNIAPTADRMFYNAATNNDALIVVNYTNNTLSIVDSIIATKLSGSNIKKGILLSS